MKAKKTFFTAQPNAAWVKELKKLLENYGHDIVSVVTNTEDLKTVTSPWIFVDGHHPELDRLLSLINPRGKAIFLVLKEDFSETPFVPEALIDGRAQDAIVYPFRPVEVISKLKSYQRILDIHEVEALNESFNGVLSRLKEDLQFAERLQNSKRKPKFPNIRGMKVEYRYLIGLKSGGDYFDLVESHESKTAPISMILTDSSNYGLSGAVLTALMGLGLRMARPETTSTLDIVNTLCSEVLKTMKEKDELSLFYGVISRKDFKMRYLNFGHSRVYHSAEGKEFSALSGRQAPLNHVQDLIVDHEYEFSLSPKDRLVFLSDGFIETAGGEDKVLKVLNEKRQNPSIDLINELSFLTKTKLKDDEFPPQDCTAVAIDLDSKQLRMV